MALWIAGKGFRCKGEALDEEHDSTMLKPSDLKRIVQKFYKRKNERNKATPGSGGMEFTHMHQNDVELGDVHHLFVDKDINLWNVVRVSPTRKEAKDLIRRVKSGDTKARVGLSYDFRSQRHDWDDHSEIKQRDIDRLSAVDEPAHHEDDTYVTHWDTTEEGLLKTLFADIYGPMSDDTLHKPFFITNALKDQVRALFDVESANEKVDEKPEKKPDEKTDAKETKKTEKSDKKEEKETKDDAMEVDTEKVKSGTVKSAATKEKVTPEKSQKNAKAETSSPLFDAPNKKDGEVGKTKDSLASSAKKNMANQETKKPKTEAAAMDADRTANDKKTTTAPAGKKKADSSAKTQEEAPKKTLKRSAPDPPVIDENENGDVDNDEEEEEVEEEEADAGDAMDIDGEEEQGDDQEEEEGDEMDEGEKAPAPPAKKKAAAAPLKKQKTDQGKKSSSSAYNVVPRDAEIQQLALQQSMTNLLKFKNLIDAPVEEKNAFLQTLFDEHAEKAKAAKDAQEIMLREVLSQAGWDEERISNMAKLSEKSPEAGAAVREMAAVAAGFGMNHKLMELQYQQGKSRANDKSIFDPAGRQRGASIFGKTSSSPMEPDYSTSIFNMLNGGNAASLFPNFYQARQQSDPSRQQQQQQPVRPKKKVNPGSSSNSRLGEKTEPILSPEEQEKKREEESHKALLDRLSKTMPNRIIRRTKFDAKNPLYSIKTEDGLPAIDTLDLSDHVLEKVTPGGYTHQFLNAITMPNFQALEDKAYTPYGHDKINDNYYGTADYNSFRAPRVISSGLITLGTDDGIASK